MGVKANSRKERDLFSVRSVKKTGKKRKKDANENEEKDGEDYGASKKFKASEVNCEPLLFKDILEGQLILGCIREVRDYEILVSLPHKLMGSIPLTNISPAYTKLLKQVSKMDDEDDNMEGIYTLNELYKIGQFLICKVITNKLVNNRHLITLSIKPEDVNCKLNGLNISTDTVIQCAIESVEDRGFVMDSGISNVRSAYLSKNEVEDTTLGIGSVIRCVVIKSKLDDAESASYIKLSAIAEKVDKTSVIVHTDMDLNQLQPGIRVETTIKSILDNGLELDLDPFIGVVHRIHLKKKYDLLTQYKELQKVTARVLYFTPLNRCVHLSLNKYICSTKIQENPLETYPVGHIIEEAEVYKSTKSLIFLKLGNKQRGCAAFDYLFGNTSDRKRTAYKVGTNHSCRIIQYNYVDQLFTVSVEKADLDKQILGYQDITIGHIFQAKIKSYIDEGAVVQLGKRETGVIPFMHLTDSSMANPELKHKVGDVVTARVFKFIPEKNLVRLSCKTTFVKSDLPLISTWSTDHIGTRTVGIVVKVFNSDLLVSLCNFVKGIVPKALATSSKVSSLKEIFKVGKCVQCIVVNMKPDKEECTLSLLLDDLKPIGPSKSINDLNKKNLTVHQYVDVTVTKVSKTSLEVTTDKNVCGEIPTYCFSDNITLSKSLFDVIRTGDVIKNALVLKNRDKPIFTLKGCFYDWLADKQDLPHKLNVEVGSVVPAVLDSMTNRDSLYVHLAMKRYGVKGLATKKDYIKESILPNSREFPKWKSVYFHINAADNKLVKGSLCLADVNISPLTSSFTTLINYFETEQFIKNALIARNQGLVTHCEIGQVLNVEVIAFENNDIVVQTEIDGVYGFIKKSHYSAETIYNKGKKLSACILAIHYSNNILELSARDEVKGVLHSNEVSKKLAVGKKYKSFILTVTKGYVLGMLTEKDKGRAVYLPIRLHLNDGYELRPAYYDSFEKEQSITIKHINGNMIYAILTNKDTDEKINLTSIRPSIEFKKTNKEIKPVPSINDTYTIQENIEKLINKHYFTTDEVFTNREKWAKRAEDNKLVARFRTQLKHKMKINTEKLVNCGFSVKKLKRDRKQRKRDRRLMRVAIWKLIDKINANKVDADDGLNELCKIFYPKLYVYEIIDEISDEEITTKEDIEALHESDSEGENEEENEMEVSENEQEENEDSGVEHEVEKDSGVEDESVEEMSPSESNEKTSSVKEDFLKLDTKGFVWTVPDEPQDDDSSSDEEDEASALRKKKRKKMTKAEQAIAAKEEERLIHEAELKKIQNAAKGPESSLEFEAILAKNPNSSLHWIQYIMFHLENAEIDKAKAVALRATTIIDKTLENEQINVWTVLLKLEAQYGTAKELENTFREAVALNCPFKIHCKMAEIYNDCNKIQEAEKLFRDMTKKFREYKNYSTIWVNYFIFLFKRNMPEKARNLLENALKSLPKKDHVDLINRFGQLEFKYGDPEKGCTTFESLVSNYFKRTDIWSVYVDMLVNQKEIDKARLVLERMAGLNLALKKMRFVFKKFMEFEKTHGTPQTVEAVKTRVEDLLAANLNKI